MPFYADCKTNTPLGGLTVAPDSLTRSSSAPIPQILRSRLHSSLIFHGTLLRKKLHLSVLPHSTDSASNSNTSPTGRLNLANNHACKLIFFSLQVTLQTLYAGIALATVAKPKSQIQRNTYSQDSMLDVGGVGFSASGRASLVESEEYALA